MRNGIADLQLIGGKPNSGKIRINSKINPSKKRVFIIDQSVTGIYDSWFELK